MSEQVPKLKQVQFNIADESDKSLLDAINNSEKNFSGETKKMWAKSLNVNYKLRKSGTRPKA